jgi:predicted PurR-regulated permease PerM
VAVALAPIIAVSIGLGLSTGAILGSNLLLLGIWMVQDHILQPKWLGGRLRLNFFATYLALFIGEHLWGAWGMFLSVPMLGVLRIIFTASKDLRPLAFAMSEEEDPAKL